MSGGDGGVCVGEGGGMGRGMRGGGVALSGDEARNERRAGFGVGVDAVCERGW